MSETPEEYQGKHEAPVASPEPNGYLSPSNYEKLKGLSLYVLPALAAAYFGIAQIWGLPKAEEVVGTVVVLETLLGVVLGRSKAVYNASEEKYDGSIVITPSEDGMADMGISLKPDRLERKDEILVKVKHPEG